MLTISLSLTAAALSIPLVACSALALTSEERDKLLTDPGVFGTFVVFQVESEWWKQDQRARAAAVQEIKAVLKKHSSKVFVEAYLIRGLSEHADFFLRVHARELLDTQNFLVEFMSTGLGKHLDNRVTLNGVTKKLIYVPGFPDEVQTALKTQTDPGPMTYAIVLPVRKDAEWWGLDQEARTAMMKEHAQASVPYLKTVKRKLYHSSGLDDLDFITYFETAKLEDFHSLVTALEQIKEHRHNRQFGHPTLVGTIRPMEEVLSVFAR